MNRTHCFFFLVFLALVLEAGGQNINISGGAVFDGEPTMAIDPANPQHIVVAWMGYHFGSALSIKTATTFNGGKNWSTPVLLPHFSPGFQSADPCLAFDDGGNVIACYIDYRQSPDSGGIYLVRSADGGLSWSYLSKALDAWADGNKAPIDRPWMTINRANNHVYITSKPAPWVPAPNRPYFIHSSDGGATWSNWRYIDGPGYLTGNYIQAPMAAPAVASDGSFHCLYPSWVVSQNLLPGYLHAQSADDGATFTYHDVIHAATVGTTDTLAKGGGHLEADPTDASHLVFVLPAAIYGDMDIFLLESRDAGQTWTSPLRLNDDQQGNGRMQDLVWSGFDEHGNFVAAWRDRRNGADTGYMTSSGIWGCMRWKDSVNFSRNFRISDTPAAYNNVLSLKGNDFMTLGAANDTLHAAWGDVRSGILNIWYARADLHSLSPQGISPITSEPVPQVTVSPNPGHGTFHLTGDPVFSLTVSDANGKIILQKSSKRPIESVDLDRNLPGMYLFWMKTRKGIVTMHVIQFP